MQQLETWFLNPLNLRYSPFGSVFGRRHSEVSFVLAAELGRAVVAHQEASLTDALALPDMLLGSVELGLLGVLQRGQVHDLLELLVEARAAHVDQGSQLSDGDLLRQIPMHALDRACDLLDLAALLEKVDEGAASLIFENTEVDLIDQCQVGSSRVMTRSPRAWYPSTLDAETPCRGQHAHTPMLREVEFPV